MTDKELRKLSRTELLELLLVQAKEIDRLNRELEQLQTQEQQRRIDLAKAGNIAEAALKLNRVFEAAQAAADQYLKSIKNPLSDTEVRCAQMLEQTQRECDAMIHDAKARTNEIWGIIRKEMFNPKLDYAQWQQISDYIEAQLNLK